MELWQADLFRGVDFAEVSKDIRLTHKLSLTTARFVYEYLKDRNGTQAAIRSGFSVKTAAQQASRLLKNVKVKEAIEVLSQKILAKCEVTAERIRYEAACIAFLNPKDIYDGDGNVKPLDKMPDHVARAVAGVEVEDLFHGHGKERECVGSTKKVRLWSKIDALKLLGQEKKMWTPEGEGAQVGRFIVVTGA